MANQFLTPSIIAKEALMHLENDLVMGNLVYTDYSKEFTKIGDTITIRRPQKFIGQDDNLDLSNYREDLIDGSTTIQMNKTRSIPIDMGAIDKTLSIEHIGERFIKPAAIALRDKVEMELAKLYSSVSNFVGTPGTVPSTFKELGAGGVVMTNGAVPLSGRKAVHDPQAALELADGLKGVYVQGKAKTAYEEASIGRYAGFDNYTSVHPKAHTVGNYGGAPRVNGASQGRSYAATKSTNSQTLNTDGWTNSVTGLLKAGDVITIEGVYAVNPVSRESTGALRTFVIVNDVDSGASTGPAALQISPAIIADGAFKTCSAVPADNAAITVKTGAKNASYRQSMLFHPPAFALVTRPLEIADLPSWKTYTMTGNKMSISVTEWGLGDDLDHNIRLDILFGVKAIYPELACRLTS